jgi:hypothetical protein
MDEHLEIALCRLKEKFFAMRQPGGRRKRVPDTLWAEAIALSRRLTPSRVVKELRLNFYSFKRRIELSGLAPAFAELEVPPPPTVATPQASNTSLVAEVIRPDGAVLRVFTTNAGLLVTAFLRP